MIEWEASEVFEKNLNAYTSGKYRYIINEGGARSSKTTSIFQLCLTIASKSNKRISAWRLKRTWIKSTLYSDAMKYLKTYGLYNEDSDNKTELIYKWYGSTLEFNGLDDYQKLHGFTQDIAWFNEAMEATKEDFDQVAMRTSEVIFIDYNPTSEDHWIYKLAEQEDAILIKSTVLDNPFIAEAIKKQILSYEPTPKNIANGTADEYNWKVYGLGMRGKKEGLIFKYSLIKEWPAEAKELGYGLDFGFNPDPSACIRVGKYDGKLVWDEAFCRQEMHYVGMEQDSIEKELRQIGAWHSVIVADSAAPTAISQLKSLGFRIEGAKKGPGSVIDGINLLLKYDILVTERSVSLIKELNNYSWALDAKTGKVTGYPIDDFNHCIDAGRYICMKALSKSPMKIKGSLPTV